MARITCARSERSVLRRFVYMDTCRATCVCDLRALSWACAWTRRQRGAPSGVTVGEPRAECLRGYGGVGKVGGRVLRSCGRDVAPCGCGLGLGDGAFAKVPGFEAPSGRGVTRAGLREGASRHTSKCQSWAPRPRCVWRLTPLCTSCPLRAVVRLRRVKRHGLFRSHRTQSS